MKSRSGVFATAAVGAGVLAALEFWALAAVLYAVADPNTIPLVVIGLLLAIGQAVWIAARRLSSAATWAAAGTAALTYLAILLAALAIAFKNADLR